MGKIFKWIGIIVVGLMMIGVAGAKSSVDKANKTIMGNTVVEEISATKIKEESSNTAKSRICKIGMDLVAGEYLLYSEGSGYFQVSNNSTGELAGIITNDNFTGTRYITVSDGQYLEFTNAEIIPEADVRPYQPKDNLYIDGMYKVGKDIGAGEYKVVTNGWDAYLEITKDSKNTINSIVINEIFEGEKYITLKDGQYIKLVGCNLIVK